jgi:formamidopyrimidine-DNA glycosylase
MPELPEVESIRLQLEHFLIGHKIISIKVNNRKTLAQDEDKLVNAKIKSVRRFGKALCIDLDNGYSAVVHLKMTGQFIYRGPRLKNPPPLDKKLVGGAPGKHTHVIFELDKKGILYFNDYRRFGWIKIVKTAQVKNFDFIKKLGPEPLDGLTPEKFSEIIGKTSRSIKLLLMDQTKIGGIGNIYANEALFLAKINPKTPAESLSHKEIKTLYKAIEIALKKGLKFKGASEQSFVNPDGTTGNFQDHTLVYGRQGEVCPNNCGGKIKKIMLGSRGTFFCSNCQK